MSATEPTQAREWQRPRRGADDSYYVDSPAGAGWVLFAGTILLLLAVMNFIYGVAAVSNSTFFVGTAKFVISDLHTWGWVLIGISAVQLVTAIGVWMQWPAVRWVGVLIASVNSVIQLIAMPAYPLWSLCLFALDMLVIYGLIAYGGPEASRMQ